jgi:hypothetical protein
MMQDLRQQNKMFVYCYHFLSVMFVVSFCNVDCKNFPDGRTLLSVCRGADIQQAVQNF